MLAEEDEGGSSQMGAHSVDLQDWVRLTFVKTVEGVSVPWMFRRTNYFSICIQFSPKPSACFFVSNRTFQGAVLDNTNIYFLIFIDVV